MKNYKIIIGILFSAAFIIFLSGCFKLQKDFNRDPQPLDPHIYKSAWQFIIDRGTDNPTHDTIFGLMYRAIIYSGIDTNEYKQPNRTFILMDNTSAKAVWSSVKTASNAAAKKWEDYPKAAVKSYLQYLIVQGIYDHYTLPAINSVTVNTLAPAGTFTASPTGFQIPSFASNPNSEMIMQILNSSPGNTSDYPVRLNDALNVYTSSILATNGTVHVIHAFLTTNQP